MFGDERSEFADLFVNVVAPASFDCVMAFATTAAFFVGDHRSTGDVVS